MAAVDKTGITLPASCAGAAQPEPTPASAIRWQASFYKSYLADALHRLASDPNPDVQRIGEQMRHCLACPSADRCVDCPFNRGAIDRVRGFAAGSRL